MSRVKKYPFEGEMLSPVEINQRYPAYGVEFIRSALTKMEPPANCRQDLDRWERIAKERVRLGSHYAASIMATQMIINPASPFAFHAKRIQKERHKKAMARLQAKEGAK